MIVEWTRDTFDQQERVVDSSQDEPAVYHLYADVRNESAHN